MHACIHAAPRMATYRNTTTTLPGYTEFRGPQLDVIQSSLEGRDTLLVMATGAGKSLCMQASLSPLQRA